jgi:hypothetical protein
MADPAEGDAAPDGTIAAPAERNAVAATAPPSIAVATTTVG